MFMKHENILLYRGLSIGKIPSLGPFLQPKIAKIQIFQTHSSGSQYTNQNFKPLSIFHNKPYIFWGFLQPFRTKYSKEPWKTTLFCIRLGLVHTHYLYYIFLPFSCYIYFSGSYKLYILLPHIRRLLFSHIKCGDSFLHKTLFDVIISDLTFIYSVIIP